MCHHWHSRTHNDMERNTIERLYLSLKIETNCKRIRQSKGHLLVEPQGPEHDLECHVVLVVSVTDTVSYHNVNNTQTQHDIAVSTTRYETTKPSWTTTVTGQTTTSNSQVMLTIRRCQQKECKRTSGRLSSLWTSSLLRSATSPHLTPWRILLPHGYSYTASCARPG